MNNIKSLIESDMSATEIRKIQEAKIKSTTFSPELEKKIKSAGFRSMTRSDYMGLAGAPSGSWIKDSGDIMVVVSPYSDGPTVEAYIDSDEGSETAQWSGNKGSKAVDNLKKIWSSLNVVDSLEEFKSVAMKLGASQVGF